MSALSETQHKTLDRIAEDYPAAKVIRLNYNADGAEMPVLKMSDGRELCLNRAGVLRSLSGSAIVSALGPRAEPTKLTQKEN